MSQPPVAPPAHPHARPTAYPLMLRTWTYEWWKPVVGLVLATAGMLVVAPIALMPLLIVTVALDHHGPFVDALTESVGLEHVTWQGMLYLNLALAAMVPITWIIVAFVHGLRPRWLASVRPGLRWRFFWGCFGLALVAIAAQVLVGMLLPGDADGVGGHLAHVDRTLLALGLVVLLTTPLQALGEEYLFRGYALQAVGALTRNPWIAIVVSSGLFALAHGVQNAPLFLDRFAFGLMAGYVVLRTGGLEAGIALHVWNNLVAFGLALAFGDMDNTLNVHGVSWWNIVLTIVQNGVYLVLVLWLARRMGVGDRTTPPAAPVLAPSTPVV